MTSLDKARWRGLAVVLPVASLLATFGGVIMALTPTSHAAEAMAFIGLGFVFGAMSWALLARPERLHEISWAFALIFSAALVIRLEMSFQHPFYQDIRNHGFPGVLPYIPLCYIIAFALFSTRDALRFTVVLWLLVMIVSARFGLPQAVNNAGRTGVFNLLLFIFVAQPISIFMLAMMRSYLDELIEENGFAQAQETYFVPDDELQDPVTELYKRSHFEGMAARSIAAAAGEKRSVGMILIDIDNLKRYNTKLGYSAGDTLLRRVSKVILSRAPVSPKFIARMRGGEFVVLCDLMSKMEMMATAERIRHAVKKAGYRIEGSDTAITVSVGTCFMQADPEMNLGSYLSCAGRTLEEAKRAGGNLVMS